MALNDDINRLARVGLFSGFPEEQLRMLAFGAKRVFLRSGEALYRDGALSDGGYLIVSGQVDIIVTSQDRDLVLSSQLENSLIGEMALVISNRRIASAVAITDCELLFISRELFKRMLLEYPELAAMIHSRIQASVQEMLKRMSQVQSKLQNIPDLAG